MSTISTDLYQNQAAHSTSIRRFHIVRELRTELIRKSIHMLIALVPSVVMILGTPLTLAILGMGVLSYTMAEYLRSRGHRVWIISRLTELASRERDRERFVLGPITLGIGAMLSLMLYPNPAAFVAIYALAFGDGLASLVGKAFGRIRIPYSGGKSLEGSLACFLAVFFVAQAVLAQPGLAVTVAIFSTLVELAPAKDFDNILMPTAIGAFVMFLI